jgi:hypothetical protein
VSSLLASLDSVPVLVEGAGARPSLSKAILRHRYDIHVVSGTVQRRTQQSNSEGNQADDGQDKPVAGGITKRK